MYKNLKISRKIAALVSAVLCIGLIILTIAIVFKLKSSLTQTAEHRFQELADARSTVVETYFDGYKQYMKSFATQPQVIAALKNPTDETLLNTLENSVQQYQSSKANMEGVFVLGTDGIAIAHSNPDIIGVAVAKNADDREKYKKNLANGPWIKGIAVSNARAELVSVCYSASMILPDNS